MDKQIKENEPILNINLIPCESVEVVNEKHSFIGVFDEIRVDKDMSGKFSVVIAFDITFPEEYSNKSPIYKMQLSIDYLRTKEGRVAKKTLPIQTFDIPPEEGNSESGSKKMLCVGEQKGLAGISGFYVFNISTVFIGEGQYQFELRGKNVILEQKEVAPSDMSIIALKPFSVVKST